MPDDQYLPIKVIHTKDSDYVPVSGGGKRKVFGDLTDEIRRSVAQQVVGLQHFFQGSFERYPDTPAVAKVTLKEEAFAKSHRPVGLFSPITCPIIGTRSIGELLIGVHPGGLSRLEERILTRSTKSSTADISTIESIAPYSVEDALGSFSSEELATLSKKGLPLRLRLFRHRHSPQNSQLQDALRSLLRELNIGFPKRIRYGSELPVYKLDKVKRETLEQLGAFVGTQSISPLPVYEAVEASSIPVRPVVRADFPAPDASRDYPLIGIIDSGVDPTEQVLNQWVFHRETYVPAGRADHDHGSFVAGMAVFGRQLNHDDERFPSAQVNIVDVCAVPKDGIAEDELLTVLEDVIPKHPGVKYWNLSLGTNSPCSDQAFSEFAIALDRLQEELGVTFVIAGGNYRKPPYRGWPPEDLGEDDRICPPAESVRAVTVGSLAHRSTPRSRVKEESPSPFSRRGPGPIFLPKPELVHYAGNCDNSGNYQQTGVLSLDGRGNIAENIGTSFSTPTIATVLASVHHEIQGEPSRSLVRALVVHSAVMRAHGVTAEFLKYRGFGIPGGTEEILGCVPWAATLVFQPALLSSHEVLKSPYPIPECLQTGGKVRGEFFMTLAYDPPLDAQAGAEYCRVNVEASLGTWRKDTKGRWRHKGQIPPEPKDIKKLYEKHLIEHGFKWAPTKVYHRNIKNGVEGDHWRLKVSVHSRSQFSLDEPQSAALIVTIADPKRALPIYDQTMQVLGRIGWEVSDLRVSDRVRLGLNAIR